MSSLSSMRLSAPRLCRPSSRVIAVAVAGAALLLPSIASAQSAVNNWKGESGAFGDATKWFDEMVPTATQIAVIASGSTSTNTTATVSAGDNFTVREVNVANGEFEFGGASAQVGDGTLVQTGGTLTSNDWFTIGRAGDINANGTYNFSGGVANKGGGGIFAVNLDGGGQIMAGASTMTMTNNAIFNNTGTGDTRIGGGVQGGTLTMSGTTQLNHTGAAQFKVGDGIRFDVFATATTNGSGVSHVGNMTMNDSSLVTINNAAFVGIFGASGTLTMNGDSKITKAGSVGQFAICDSFFIREAPTTGVLTLHDNASINFATNGTAGVDGEFWIGQGLNGTGTLNMDGNSSIRVRNRVLIGRAVANGTFNLAGNATFTLDGAFSDFRVGAFDQGKGVVNQTGGTLNVVTGFTAIGDGFNDTAAGASQRLAQQSSYNMSGGVAHFGVGVDVGAFGEASGLLNISGGAADANFMFVAAPGSRAANELRISGGSLTINGDIDFGASRDVNASATVNLSGTGVLTMNRPVGLVTVGEQTLATINMTGSSRFESNAFLLLGSRNASEGTAEAPIGTGTGIINLNGGTLAAVSVRKGLGNGTVNFNGGKLQAMANEADFIRNFATADLNAQAGHAIIDSNGFTVTVNAALGGTGGLTKVGAGTLELAAVQQYAGRTRIEAGTLRTNATTGVSRFTSLEFAGTTAAPVGQLDIAGKPLVIDYTGSVDLNAIRQAIGAGRAAGSTNGITSAGMPANQSIGYALASEIVEPPVFGTVDDTSVLLRSTISGDADLSGNVGFSDLVSLAQSYNGTNKFWSNGDFDYDGTVAFSDLVILAQNYNQSLSAAQTLMLGSDFAADFALAQAFVPEPTTLGLLAGVSTLMLGRRRTKA